MSALSTFSVRPGVTTSSQGSDGSSPGSSSASDTGHENEYLNLEPSETAALTALFGWTLPPPTEEKAASQRAASIMPSLSRASSVVSFQNERSATPQPTPSISQRRSLSPEMLPESISTRLPPPLVSATHTPQQKRDASLLYCKMCQRRVGLWAFGPQAVEKQNRPQRQFDLLKEHRPYCPYVVRSTIVPSFPTPSGHSAVLNGASGNANANANPREVPIEGWRAMLSIVLKARKRPSHGPTRNSTAFGTVAVGAANGSTESFTNVDEMRVDPVEAMVEGVKKRGVSFCLDIVHYRR